MKKLITLACLFCILYPVVAQVKNHGMSASDLTWFRNNLFEVDVYKWNDEAINQELKKAAETRSLRTLSSATEYWYRQNGLIKYSGEEAFRKPQNVDWLRKRNIHVEYYDGTIPEASEQLKLILDDREGYNMTKTIAGGSAVAGGLFVIVGILGHFSQTTASLVATPAEDKSGKFNNMIVGGSVLALTGTLIFTVTLKSEKSAEGMNLRKFHQLWFPKIQARFSK